MSTEGFYILHMVTPEESVSQNIGLAILDEAQFNYQTILDKTPCRIAILGEGETPMLMLANGHPWKEIPGIVAKNVANALSQELFN